VGEPSAVEAEAKATLVATPRVEGRIRRNRLKALSIKQGMNHIVLSIQYNISKTFVRNLL
jgi:hypothetical protein